MMMGSGKLKIMISVQSLLGVLCAKADILWHRLGPMADGARPPNTTNAAPADPLLGPGEAPVAL
jgi:hypothetical protein